MDWSHGGRYKKKLTAEVLEKEEKKTPKKGIKEKTWKFEGEFYKGKFRKNNRRFWL